ncbi:putative nucleic acid-binding protein [Helianthus debilis subsp. tardiflorus]
MRMRLLFYPDLVLEKTLMPTKLLIMVTRFTFTVVRLLHVPMVGKGLIMDLTSWHIQKFLNERERICSLLMLLELLCGVEIWKYFRMKEKRMNFDLQDVQGELVHCTLWNGYAQQFNDFLAQNNPIENVMDVIQHAKIKLWQGQYTVQNNKFGTQLFLNEEIDEVNELRRRLLVKQFEGGASSSQTILSS